MKFSVYASGSMEQKEARRTIGSQLALLRERSKRTATRWSWFRDCGRRLVVESVALRRSLEGG